MKEPGNQSAQQQTAGDQQGLPFPLSLRPELSIPLALKLDWGKEEESEFRRSLGSR